MQLCNLCTYAPINLCTYAPIHLYTYICTGSQGPYTYAPTHLYAYTCTGTPADARHEAGRTALMLAANNGRLDLCTLLLDAGASASAVDNEGSSPLHACCLDLHLAAERDEAELDSNPAACVALLLARGAHVGARETNGATALAHCERQRKAHAVADACAVLLEEWEGSKALEVTCL